MLTRDAILSAEDLRTETVEVPEWGGTVMVRELSAKERDEYETSIVSVKGTKLDIDPVNMRAKLVSMGCVDEDGNRLFTLDDAEDLGKKSSTALDRIYDKIQEISGMGEGALEDAGKD